MDDRSQVIDYAREVYAACATVGDAAPGVARLKALLDAEGDEGAGYDGGLGEILDLARRVQADAVVWASQSAGGL